PHRRCCARRVRERTAAGRFASHKTGERDSHIALRWLDPGVVSGHGADRLRRGADCDAWRASAERGESRCSRSTGFSPQTGAVSKSICMNRFKQKLRNGETVLGQMVLELFT